MKSVKEDILHNQFAHIDYLLISNVELQRKNYLLEAGVTEVEDRLAKVDRQLNQVKANNRKSKVGKEHRNGSVQMK